MNSTVNADAKCPFYQSETQKSVTCEGIVGKYMMTRFSKISDKVEHEKKCCCDNYTSCPVNRAIMQKYTAILLAPAAAQRSR